VAVAEELGVALLVQADRVVVEEAEEDRGTQVQDNLEPQILEAGAVVEVLINRLVVMALRA
jgi:hypothetical protein